MGRGFWALALSCITLAPAMASAQAAPPEGAWLRYRYEQRLVDGTGAYGGFEEATVARARYEVVAVGENQATIHGQYAWSYASPDRTDTGVENRTASFSLETRHYLDARTDVSDYDQQDGRELATWIWIPPDVSARAPVSILERDFSVTSTGIPIDVAGTSRRAIALVARGQGSRDDAYGQLRTQIFDRYWFDAETGMFLREVHEEHASGTFEGEPASFRLVTTIELVDASYAPVVPAPPEESYLTPPPYPEIAATGFDDGGSFDASWLLLLIPFLFGVAVFAMMRGVTRSRRRGPTETATGERFRIRTDATPAKVCVSSLFDPFVPHLMSVARAAKHGVAIAEGTGGTVLGVAIDDPSARVATIFARDSDVCEALRLTIGETEFFSDVRHPALASVTKLSLSAPPEAYNVYETYELMQLDARPDELGYDTDIIGRMRSEHRAPVVALLESVYGVPCAAWLDASIESGDLGWIAEENGQVVGVAMATVIDDRARLHTLTVHPDARNRGIGTALYRARVRALFDMGVTSVLTECATWNVAALELARAHGFQKVGVMYVESARDVRQARKFVRR